MNKLFEHDADVCVIGGGLAGMCAAISAARHGARTVLINDRAMLGGNCSSEIRMWPCGAHGRNNGETGIYEEIMLDNMYYNPRKTYPSWDAVLYNIVHSQENLELFLNCSVNDAETEDNVIKSVTGWQLTTYRHHKFTAKIFIDCSGDSILAELTGAEYRHGREARSDYGEEAAPEMADSMTMGSSCLLQAIETPGKVEFKAPPFAEKIEGEEAFIHRGHWVNTSSQNFWWLELGGERNTIDDAEEIRDDLLALAYGAWDHIKNQPGHDADNWDLDFAGFLPGKRESRRYIGDHILTQPEVAAGGKFDDTVAYGGWKIDDHPPTGFRYQGPPNRTYPCPSPFGIPYRCLYSVNIKNLMFAGRNISVTHAAMAASRVMATCALLGQAAGTAASVAIENGILPRDVCGKIKELQQRLIEDDCWLPGFEYEVSKACREAELVAENADNTENLRYGITRDENDKDNGCTVALQSTVEYKLCKPAYVEQARIVFDSDINRDTVTGWEDHYKRATICNRPLDFKALTFPSTLVTEFEVIADGNVIAHVTDNHQRLIKLPINKEISSLALRPIKTSGSEKAHIYAFDFK